MLKAVTMFPIRPFRRRNRQQLPSEEWHPWANFPQSIQEFLESGFDWDQTMKVDIQDKEDEYVLEAEVPGANKDNIDIDVHDDYLTIRVRHEDVHEEKQENFIRKERRTSSCQRSFYVGDVNTEAIEAKYEDGVLRLHLPKLEPGSSRRRKIDIQ